MKFSLERVGATKALLSEHVNSDEVKSELDRFLSMTVIGLGQGGGRIAAEMSRFGMPTYILNSSKTDMDEHNKLIPDSRRILTKSKQYDEIEGTSKNAALGFQIAKENQDEYKKVALNEDVQNADFVWVSVSLGGGTGNGALKVALAFLSKVRSNRSLPNGKIPLGVICSIPSKDERGSNFRKNALAGISELQKLITEGKIGSVLVIDNEKMYDYYSKSPLRTYGGTEIDAKSYSNMLVSTLIVETGTIPLLKGRSVLDKAELLDTYSTPGWLYLSKYEKDFTSQDLDTNAEGIIKDLFTKNDVLAQGNIENVKTGAVAVVYPENKNISPKLVDDVFRFTSDLLKTPIHLSISGNSKVENVTLYGIYVTVAPPKRISELKTEYEEMLEMEKRQEEKEKQLVASLELDGFNDFLNDNSLQKRKNTNLDDLDLDFNEPTEEKAELATLDSLDDIEF